MNTNGWSSFLSRLTLAGTTAVGIGLSSGLIPPKYAAYGGLLLAFIQAFQHPVQLNQPQVVAADHAAAVVAATTKVN